MLERYAMKVARTVLRGGSGSNVTPLPDHPTGGSLRVFRPFVWLGVDSDKIALSRPTHQRVTPTVSPPLANQRRFLEFELFHGTVLAKLVRNKKN
jgi:hypothetical protein